MFLIQGKVFKKNWGCNEQVVFFYLTLSSPKSRYWGKDLNACKLRSDSEKNGREEKKRYSEQKKAKKNVTSVNLENGNSAP